MVPTIGAEGVGGCAGITTSADDGDVQPSELVTVKVYVPEFRPEIVVLVPVPVVVIPPGERVTVHVPVAGNPFNTTLPVDRVQVGGVMVPTTGAVGVTGWVLITILADDNDIHPAALVTV